MTGFQERERVWKSSPRGCWSPRSRDINGACAAVCSHVQAKLENTSDRISMTRLEGQQSVYPLALEESRIEILIITLKTSTSLGCL